MSSAVLSQHLSLRNNHHAADAASRNSCFVRGRGALRGAEAGHAIRWKPSKCLVGVRAKSRAGGDDEAPGGEKVDRRELLAGMAGVSVLGTAPLSAVAVPVLPPDLSACQPATITGSVTVDCCLPESASDPIVHVPAPTIRKLRRPAHLVSDAYKQKYNKAYALMKGLDDDDPRSLKQQADVHCAFCNGAYMATENPTALLQVHLNWLFLPWHRYYLYFHERILASLIDDPTFALPYWNWDDQRYGGNVMPSMFLDESLLPGLYDPNRNPDHLPPAVNTLSYLDSGLPNDEIVANNLAMMYTSVVAPSTASLFMGLKPPYTTGNAAAGSLEMGAHTGIHAFVGNPENTYREDMGNFYSAGRDPIFYAHHSNVDRMWVIWSGLGGRRHDHTDTDFLTSSFVFYDENAELVKVSVKDCLDSYRQMGIEYERSRGDGLWLGYEAGPRGTKGVVPSGVSDLTEFGARATGKTPLSASSGGTTISSLVSRPTTTKADFAAANSLEEEEVEEVLVLQNVTVPMSSVMNLAIFINLPDADASTTLNVAEYVGSFANVPHLGAMAGMTSAHDLSLRFAISENLTNLGLEDQTKIAVTVVVKALEETTDPITIGGFSVEYD